MDTDATSAADQMPDITAYPEWRQAVIDAQLEFTFGDTIPHEWLYQHFDMKPPDHGTANQFKRFQFKFLSYVESFKSHMLEHNQMLLISSRGIGYLIVEPENQTDISWEIMSERMGKELNRASARLTNIMLDMLSDTAKDDNMLKRSTLAALRSANQRMIESTENGDDDGAI